MASIGHYCIFLGVTEVNKLGMFIGFVQNSIESGWKSGKLHRNHNRLEYPNELVDYDNDGH